MQSISKLSIGIRLLPGGQILSTSINCYRLVVTYYAAHSGAINLQSGVGLPTAVLFSSHHLAYLLSPSLSIMGRSSQEAASSSSGAGSVGQTSRQSVLPYHTIACRIGYLMLLCGVFIEYFKFDVVLNAALHSLALCLIQWPHMTECDIIGEPAKC